MAVAMAPRAEGGEPAPATSQPNFLIDPKLIAAPDIGDEGDFTAYRAVILANVSRLNTVASGALARFVAAGGGLWILPGERSDGGFYNNWTDASGLHVMPATMGAQRALPPGGVAMAAKTFNHPALERLATAGQSDASDALVRAYWPLAVDRRNTAVRIGGMLQDGSPLLVERKLGKGRVLMTAMSLDHHDANLPALNCFVPLVHEAVYYLCEAAVPETNIPPSEDVTLTMLPGADAAGLHLPAGAVVPVDSPSGRRKMATVLTCGPTFEADFRGAEEPGLYTLLPAGEKAGAVRLPFVVKSDPQESNLAALSEGDLARVGKILPVFHAQNSQELLSAISGEVPGREIWKMLALAALAGLLLESALARWIARGRKSQKVEAVTFGATAPVKGTKAKRPARQAVEALR